MLNPLLKHLTWKAVLISGLVGGTVFLLTNLILAPAVLDINMEVLLRYMGALVLGSDSLTETGSGALVIGVLVHYVLSILFAALIAIVVHRWGMGIGIVGGALMGLALYSINIYSLTTLVEWFFAINSSVLLLSHVLYGAVVGGVYEIFDHYDLGLAPERAS